MLLTEGAPNMSTSEGSRETRSEDRPLDCALELSVRIGMTFESEDPAPEMSHRNCFPLAPLSYVIIIVPRHGARSQQLQEDEAIRC